MPIAMHTHTPGQALTSRGSCVNSLGRGSASTFGNVRERSSLVFLAIAHLNGGSLR